MNSKCKERIIIKKKSPLLVRPSKTYQIKKSNYTFCMFKNTFNNYNYWNTEKKEKKYANALSHLYQVKKKLISVQ